MQGRVHEKEKKPCQDKHYVWRSKDKKEAGIALADGAGSSDYSQIGAEYSVTAIIPFVKKNFNELFSDPATAGGKIVNYLLGGLSEVTLRSNLILNDMACTLLFVHILCRKKTIQYIAGHIGDGVIVFVENNKIKVLSKPERGEHANETIFLTSKNSLSRFRVYSGVMLKRKAGFIIMSDGAAETLYVKRNKEPNQIYCQTIFAYCDKNPQRVITKALCANLNGIFREVSSDDCSLCVLRVT